MLWSNIVDLSSIEDTENRKFVDPTTAFTTALTPTTAPTVSTTHTVSTVPTISTSPTAPTSLSTIPTSRPTNPTVFSNNNSEIKKGCDNRTNLVVYSKWLPANKKQSITEAVAVQACAGHPNIITMLDCYRVDSQIVLVFERLYLTPPMTRAICVQWFKQLLEAVQHVHAAGYVHHDIAPRNLLTDHPHPGLKLIDFGLAARYGDDGFCNHGPWATSDDNTSPSDAKCSMWYDIYCCATSYLKWLLRQCGKSDQLYLVVNSLQEKGVSGIENLQLSDSEAKMLQSMLDTIPEQRPTTTQLLALPLWESEEMKEEKISFQLFVQNDTDANIRKCRQQDLNS